MLCFAFSTIHCNKSRGYFDDFSGNSSSWNFRNLEFWAKILVFSEKTLSFWKNSPALGENVEFLLQKLTLNPNTYE